MARKWIKNKIAEADAYKKAQAPTAPTLLGPRVEAGPTMSAMMKKMYGAPAVGDK